MKLYGMATRAPNPRRVRILLAEKGIDLAETPVDLMKREHKATDYLAKNSLGQIPTLELDDGTTISESIAICQYFEDTHPEPALFGRGALEKSQVTMWVWRIESVLLAPARQFWRHAHPRTAALLTQFNDFGESNRAIYAAAQHWLDNELKGRTFIDGAAFSMADICALCTVDFATSIGLPLEPGAANLMAWHAGVSARPSAKA